MLRQAEPRDVLTNSIDGYSSRQRGYDKHWGTAVCFITVNRNMYWWNRLTVNTGIMLKENTDPCSPIKQKQVIRESPLTIDLESMIPGNTNNAAKKYIYDLRPGATVVNLWANVLEDLFKTGSAGATSGVGGSPYIGGQSAYGDFIVERSSVEFTKDDFSQLRITLRSLGYGVSPAYTGDDNASTAVAPRTETYQDELDDLNNVPANIIPLPQQ